MLGPLGSGRQGRGTGGSVVGAECEGCSLSGLLKVDQYGLVEHLKDSVGDGDVQGHWHAGEHGPHCDEQIVWVYSSAEQNFS